MENEIIKTDLYSLKKIIMINHVNNLDLNVSVCISLVTLFWMHVSFFSLNTQKKKDLSYKISLDLDILHISFVHVSQHLAGLLLFLKHFMFQISKRIRGFLVGALFQGEGIQRKGSVAWVFET